MVHCGYWKEQNSSDTNGATPIQILYIQLCVVKYITNTVTAPSVSIAFAIPHREAQHATFINSKQGLIQIYRILYPRCVARKKHSWHGAVIERRIACVARDSKVNLPNHSFPQFGAMTAQSLIRRPAVLKHEDRVQPRLISRGVDDIFALPCAAIQLRDERDGSPLFQRH